MVKRIISFALVLACMVVIFLMSAESGEESTDTSDGVVYFIAKMTVSGFSEMTEAEKLGVIDNMSGFIRTAGHFCEFAALGFLSLNALLTFNIKFWLKAGYAFLFSVFYAVTDEIHQYFVPDRACDIKDIAVDSLGAFTGIAILGIIVIVLKLRSRKNDTQNRAV